MSAPAAPPSAGRLSAAGPAPPPSGWAVPPPALQGGKDPAPGLEVYEGICREEAGELGNRAREGAAKLRRALDQSERLLRVCQDEYEAEDGAPPLRREELAAKLALVLTWNELGSIKRSLGDETDSDASLVRAVRDTAAGGPPSPALLQAEASHSQSDMSASVAKGIFREFTKFRNLALNHPTNSARVLQQLRLSEPVVERLRREAEQHGTDRQRAVGEEDYPSAWSAQEREIDALSEMVTVLLERVGHLDCARNNDKSLAEAKGSADAIQREVAEGQRESKTWSDRIQAEEVRISDALAEADEKHRETMAGVTQAREGAATELAANAQTQSEVMDQIEELYAQLAKLAGARGDTVQKVVAAEKEGQQKRAQHKQLLTSADQHRALLADLRSRSQGLSDHLAAIEAAADREFSSLRDASNAATEELSQAALRERRAHYKEFGSLYAMCGDRLYSQERRVEELDSQADAARWRLRVARDTMDPEGTSVCRDGVRRLEAAHNEAREAAAVLRTRMDEAATDATVTEEALHEAGDQVVSSVQLVREELADRAARLSAARKEAHARRGSAVDAQAEAASELRPPPHQDSADPPASPSSRVPPLAGAAAGAKSPTSADASERRKRAYDKRIAALGDSPATQASPPRAAWPRGDASPAPAAPPTASWASPQRGPSIEHPQASPARQAPGSPAPWSDVPSAEALRRRAEELRRAAEEARERAAQHRAKAEALGRDRLTHAYTTGQTSPTNTA